MARSRLRSLRVPITFAAVTVPLALALLVGWTMFTWRRIEGSEQVVGVWLLVFGVVGFTTIMTILVLFSVFLGNQILEVRRQDGFIDSVTHELKSPLASIKLCLQTLERSGLEDHSREELRQMIHADVDRLAAFIDDVLEASRFTHADATVHLSRFDLIALIDGVSSSMRNRYQLQANSIVLDAPNSLFVNSDRAAMEIVVRNLLDNACKYGGDEPRVKVCAQRVNAGSGDRLTLSVKDHGIGMNEAEAKRIFQRFYRSSEAEVRKRKGTGLGLFVVSAWVKNLGGRVWAESEGRGFGTTFKVDLPYSAPNDEQGSSAHSN